MAGTASRAAAATGPRALDAARLVAIGAAGPREFRLERGRIRIGTASDNDVAITDSTVSRHHAEIRRRMGRYRLSDLESTNGTFLNGRRIRTPVTLKRGDEVRFGAVRFAFLAPGQTLATRRRSVASRARRFAAMILVLFAGGFALASFVLGRGAWRRVAERAMPSDAGSAAPSSAAAPSASASAALAAANTPAAEASSAPGAAGAATGIPPSGAEPQWLARLNRYRALAKLAAISEDPALSQGDNKHAVYLVKNYGEVIKAAGLGAEAHTEEQGNPWYSPEGAAAARSSDIDEWYMPRGSGEITPAAEDPDSWSAARAPGTPAWTIDGWISLPLHRLPILNPRLRTAGYGLYCEDGQCAAALDLGEAFKSDGKMRLLAAPIEFPPDGSTLPFREFGSEWPDPRTSCPGFEAPSGLAITIQLGDYVDARMGAYSLERVGAEPRPLPVEACGFDAWTYQNPDTAAQSRVRSVLRSFGAVVLIPRAPLDPGAKYDVAMTVNGREYKWSFSTSP